MIKSKKAEAMQTLVWVVILGLTLIVLFNVAVKIGLIYSQSADAECATSVAYTRSQATREGPAKLIGCDTRLANVEEMGERKFNEQFTQDLEWCARSFAVARDKPLVTSDQPFCHLCAFYRVEDEITLEELSRLEESDDDEATISFLSTFAQLQDQRNIIERTSATGDFGIVYFESADFDNQIESLFGTQQSASITGGTAATVAGLAVAYIVSAPVSVTTSLVVLGVGGAGALGGFIVSPYVLADDIKGSTLVIPHKPDWFAENGCEVVRATN